MATIIRAGEPLVTLINVFTVAPERQQELVELLDRATEETMRHQPGFISAHIHRSLDGTRVVNYAQWKSQEDFRAMLRSAEVRPHMEAALRIATAEPKLYEVVSAHHIGDRG
jgi:quinol monooxygenase YgiN